MRVAMGVWGVSSPIFTIHHIIHHIICLHHFSSLHPIIFPIISTSLFIIIFPSVNHFIIITNHFLIPFPSHLHFSLSISCLRYRIIHKIIHLHVHLYNQDFIHQIHFHHCIIATNLATNLASCHPIEKNK